MYQENKWDDIYTKRYLASYPNTKIVSFVIRTFGDNPKRENIKILDLGCGGGNNTWFLAREGFDTYAFDGSSGALKLARAKLKAHFKKGNFVALEHPDCFFDAIVDDYCVEANVIRDTTKIFSEIYRTLKPKGKYFGLMLSSENKSMMKGNFIEPRTLSMTEGDRNARDRCIHFFTHQEIKSLLLGAAFSQFEINYEIVSYKNALDVYKSWIVEAVK